MTVDFCHKYCAACRASVNYLYENIEIHHKGLKIHAECGSYINFSNISALIIRKVFHFWYFEFRNVVKVIIGCIEHVFHIF